MAGLVLTAVNPASRKIDNGQSLLDGKWASTFSADFDKNLAIRDTSIKLWATVNNILFDEARKGALVGADRSEENTSDLQYLMRTSYAVFCLKKHTYIN